MVKSGPAFCSCSYHDITALQSRHAIPLVTMVTIPLRATCSSRLLSSNNRDLKQRRRRRQGRRLEKNEFIFYRRISHMPRSVQYVYRSQNLLKLNVQCQRTIPKENTKNKPPSLTFSKIPRTWSFHVVVLQRTAKKCTKNYNARAQLLFCSLNLLFCGVLVAVAVVVCLRSLISEKDAFSPNFIKYSRCLDVPRLQNSGSKSKFP